SVTTRHPRSSIPLPYTTLFRSRSVRGEDEVRGELVGEEPVAGQQWIVGHAETHVELGGVVGELGGRHAQGRVGAHDALRREGAEDRKSTRLNSSHVKISYAVVC